MPSIYPFDPSDAETFTVVTNPRRAYTSSSLVGSTGAVRVLPHGSTSVKDATPDSSFVESAHDDADLSSLLKQVQAVARDIRNGSNVTVSGRFYASFFSGSFRGVAFPNSDDPFILPQVTVLVYPTLDVSGNLVSGSTIVLSGGTGVTPASGTFTFTPQVLGSDFPAMVGQYMAAVAHQAQAARYLQSVEPIRFSPPPLLNSNTLRKLIIHDQLNPFYRIAYPTAHWAYTNYNTLNFFTASTVPSDSVIMYPNIDGGNGPLLRHDGYCSGTYTPSGSVSFDFYINPRYGGVQQHVDFKAGTVLHLSSTFALSLVSGSGRDANGLVSGFRLQLQLSRSADIPPSWVAQGSNGAISVSGPSGSYSHTHPEQLPPADLIFLSDDNALQRNHWHHVVVRWGTNAAEHGTGSFNVDGTDMGTFVVPSGTFTPSLADIVNMRPASLPAEAQQCQPTVLCLGNFYEGPNNTENPQAAFFALDPATRDGLNVMWPIEGIEAPASYSFVHPLNAELHNVAIRRCYLSDVDIAASSSRGPSFLDDTFALYVPPFFVEQSPFRRFVNDHGGILVTPFEEVDGATYSPFSVALSFGVAGHYINLENFVRDFGSNNFPMLHHLTGVAIQGTTDAETCNEFLYGQPYVAKRNLTVLPCDDGLFVPSFQLLASQSLARAVDDLGVEELSFITLDNMVTSSAVLFGPGTFDDGNQSSAAVSSVADQLLGATPETPFAATGQATRAYYDSAQSGSQVELGAPLTVFQRTQDGSSNEVVVFDISNLFYGFRIDPGTFTLSEPDLLSSSLLGSNMVPSAGPVSINLADDGMGNLYRADCLTSQSTWNSVGNLYYDEGLALIKSPHLYFYGLGQYAMTLRGEQHVHVMKLDVIAPNNQLNSSSNPSYLPLPPTGLPNDPEDAFVYISGIHFHDRDLNVVMKAQLAQPIAKRPGDRVMFKVKFDA